MNVRNLLLFSILELFITICGHFFLLFNILMFIGKIQ